ncbi:MAG TPA: ABC transporter permease [Gemmatimonadaceae bacterium]|nr:ABC transporter permease [Gemmatimonadaceae bacterium]
MNPFEFIGQTLRIAVPYLFAAQGGVIAERAGIISLTLEGFMLGGAFTGALGSYYTGSAWLGLALGMAGGLAFGALHAVATVRFNANHVVAGIAINLFAIGITRVILKLLFDSTSNSPRVEGFGTGLQSFSNPIVWMGLLVTPVVAWMLYRTTFGLRVRAAGEHPEAAESVGVRVNLVRYAAVAMSGILAGLGGVYLALDQHQFTDGMTAGRGFIALAAVIFGRWDPWRAAGACLLFAAAETLQIQLQSAGFIPAQFVAMIPYLLTIIALAGVVGRSLPPAALGRVKE